jgi:hypothetical protein
LGGSQLGLSLPGSTAVVTIDGGSGVTLDGNNATRVLAVAGGVEATLRHLTIAHGHIFDNGGGILNQGSLTISNCTLSSNTAATFAGGRPTHGGGIFSTSMLTVTDSTISNNLSGNGGGISTDDHGTLTVSNCNLTGNLAIHQTGGGGGYGGGIIASASSVTVNNSTLVNNVGGAGGGIATTASTVTVSNCTLAGNRSDFDGGGIYILPDGSMVTVSNSTLTGNSASRLGGGIANLGLPLNLSNTIVAANRCDIGDPDIDGRYTRSHSLVGGNPLLAPLGYYGGPSQTFALLPGSPARGTGDPAVTGTDQRGQPRGGPASDIGAFQTQADPFLVTTLQDPGRQPGQLSLREAVNLANALPANNTVSFDPGLASGTVILTAGELLLDHSLALVGPTAGPVAVSGNTASRVVEVAAGTSVSLTGLTITNGLVSSANLAQGGGILNAGNLTLTDCTITNNQVSASLTGTGTETPLAQGGGIYTTGPLTLVRCMVSGNSASLTAGDIAYGNANGGGLYANGCTVTLTDSTVSGNSSVGTYTGRDGEVSAYGGGLTGDFSTLTLTGCTLSGNTATGGNADGYGGAVHGYQTTATLTDCTIADNAAGSGVNSGGGGVSDWAGSFTLTSCTVTGNAVATTGGTGVGGGVYFDGTAASFAVRNTIVARDSADGSGPDAAGSFSSLGSNLVGITDGSAGWVGSDLTGTGSSPLDPLLGTLGDYGGPTQTIPLLAGSPALDAGDPGQLGTPDQRGVVRTGGVNIGAFQASAAALLVTAPATATAGVPFDVSVAVYDQFGQLAVGYTGTVTISTTDPDPGVVLPADYTFTPADGGSHTFSAGCTLITPGEQTLTVTDRDAGFSASLTLSVSP